MARISEPIAISRRKRKKKTGLRNATSQSRARTRTRTPRPRLPRETLEEKRRRARAVFTRLAEAYPDARCSLNFSSPLELLVATVLSAQCTDVRVNLVTPALFAKYRTAADYARAAPGELEEDIR
ncbi:MAG TPA: hypothetical protein VOA00_08640, partial [Thermoanaerobaculia bacterium]|nr:hypothetical protein [Thermoanaerobaculia bacterium]